MKKRIISLLLAVTMLLGLAPAVALPVKAADKSLDNFASNAVYTGFPDVSETEWYYASVKQAYELGLMNGSNGLFDPNGGLTIVQSIVLAARIHSIYHTGEADFTNGDPWYRPYVDYCLENDIIDSEYPNYDAPATRGEFAKILAYALPEKDLPVYNEIEDGAISDVPMTMAATKASSIPQTPSAVRKPPPSWHAWQSPTSALAMCPTVISNLIPIPHPHPCPHRLPLPLPPVCTTSRRSTPMLASPTFRLPSGTMRA